ncbi:MAG: DUF2269 domain-containing protein [Rhizobiales bacterium]|nr:DUF2269 domain-containing protein [Hyphomicrobiales bacterium]
MDYHLLKAAHVIGACVLLGTGAGIAFFMLAAHLTGDSRLIAGVARIVVVADALFTASAVVAQPTTGYLLSREIGVPLGEPWLRVSIGLYLTAGAVWLPVVWIQARMARLARAAADDGAPLPDAYHRLFRWWLACGVPGFGAVLAIVWLMIAKPAM